MIITTKLYNEEKDSRTKLLLTNLAAIYGDADINMPHLMAYYMMHRPLWSFNKYMRILSTICKKMHIPMSGILYIQENPTISLSKVVNSVKNFSGSHKDFAFACGTIYFSDYKLLTANKNDYYDGALFGYKMPQWFIKIMDQHLTCHNGEYLFANDKSDYNRLHSFYGKINMMLRERFLFDMHQYRTTKIRWHGLKAKLFKW